MSAGASACAAKKEHAALFFLHMRAWLSSGNEREIFLDIGISIKDAQASE